jgi:hypothetical protein
VFTIKTTIVVPDEPEQAATALAAFVAVKNALAAAGADVAITDKNVRKHKKTPAKNLAALRANAAKARAVAAANRAARAA